MRRVGKTTVLTRILKEMRRRGLRVGTVKHISGRSTFNLADGKDTSRHLEAGSLVTIAVTSSEIVAVRRDIPATLESALQQMPIELDYVLVEGFRESEYPKIVVEGSDSESPLKVKGETIAVIQNGKRMLEAGEKDQVKELTEDGLVDLIDAYFSHQ
jgi:molybdopterin-guanine dinucleotide biosynthesis protein MobB